jgi:hypothetical protein
MSDQPSDVLRAIGADRALAALDLVAAGRAEAGLRARAAAFVATISVPSDAGRRGSTAHCLARPRAES